MSAELSHPMRKQPKACKALLAHKSVMWWWCLPSTLRDSPNPSTQYSASFGASCHTNTLWPFATSFTSTQILNSRFSTRFFGAEIGNKLTSNYMQIYHSRKNKGQEGSPTTTLSPHLSSPDLTWSFGAHTRSGWIQGHQLKIILTTPTPHISKKYAPEICHKMRGRTA